MSLILILFTVLFGLSNAAVLINSGTSLSDAALELSAVACGVTATQTYSDGNTWSSVLYVLGLALLLYLHAASLVNLALPGSKGFTGKETEESPRKDAMEVATARVEGNVTDAQTPPEPKKAEKKPKKSKKQKQSTEDKEGVETEALRKSFEIADEPPGFSPSSAQRPPKKEHAKKPRHEPKPEAEPTEEESKQPKHKKHHSKKAGGFRKPPPNADF